MNPTLWIPYVIVRCAAAGMAFLAIGSHPYNFYTLTRWCVFAACVFGVSLTQQTTRKIFSVLFVLMALLFNPLMPFHFMRDTWHILDLTAGIVLLASLTQKPHAI